MKPDETLNECNQLKTSVESDWSGDKDNKTLSKEIEFEKITNDYYNPISQETGSDLNELRFNLEKCFKDQFFGYKYIGKGIVNVPFGFAEDTPLIVTSKILSKDFIEREDIDTFYIEYTFKGNNLIIKAHALSFEDRVGLGIFLGSMLGCPFLYALKF